MEFSLNNAHEVSIGFTKGIYTCSCLRSDGDLAIMLEALEAQFEQLNFDDPSSQPSLSSSEAPSLSFGELQRGSSGSFEYGHAIENNGSTCNTNGSSPVMCNMQISQRDYGVLLDTQTGTETVCACMDALDDAVTSIKDIELMKEKFAKLLLGEDMSGAGNGVCSALAISNAITNLSASVFGELWRLEPLSINRKAMWKREMGLLLSVVDHIVELVPSLQALDDGSKFEVMLSRPRSDLHANLPALRKLDTMLLESLDSFIDTEFWYADQGIDMTEESRKSMHNQAAEKWWLPTPKVPLNGLSDDGKRHLLHQKENLSQVLKAARAINSDVLSEMEIPNAYWDALPKSGKTSLGEVLYRHITLEYFSPQALLSSLDLSTEHKAIDVANRLEAAVHVWRRRQRQTRNGQALSRDSRPAWSIVKDNDRREVLAGRAESLLLCLKQRFPSLSQSVLDTTKIQHNKDVGHSILESYSRVLESLAFNIIARIDDILQVDFMARRVPQAVSRHAISSQRWLYSVNLSVQTPNATPSESPGISPSSSPSSRKTPNSPFYCNPNRQLMLEISLDDKIVDSPACLKKLSNQISRSKKTSDNIVAR